jgi:hypothetical protein
MKSNLVRRVHVQLDNAAGLIEEVLNVSDYYEFSAVVPRSLADPTENAESDVHGLTNVVNPRDLSRCAATRCNGPGILHYYYISRPSLYRSGKGLICKLNPVEKRDGYYMHLQGCELSSLQ